MLERGQEVKLGKALEIVVEPDPRLHQVSLPVAVVDDEVRSKIDDMVATMIHDDGAGIAAVQVGIMQRIFIIYCGCLIGRDGTSNEGLPPQTTVLRMINPEIIEKSGDEEKQEGCLSVPGVSPEVSRSTYIKVKYVDYWGKEQELGLYHWIARCFQHEMDHLNGITLLNQLSPLKKSLVVKKLQKMQKRFS